MRQIVLAVSILAAIGFVIAHSAAAPDGPKRLPIRYMRMGTANFLQAAALDRLFPPAPILHSTPDPYLASRPTKDEQLAPFETTPPTTIGDGIGIESITPSAGITGFQGTMMFHSGEGWIPPDTQGAAGPNHFVEAVNGEFVIYNRSGTIISYVTLDNFWRNGGIVFPNTGHSFDPRLFYDPYSNRWVLVCSANAKMAQAVLLIAASQTSDPTGLWSVGQIPTDSGKWPDFPHVGFNKNWVAVAANMLVDDSYQYSNLYAVNKSTLYNSGTVAYRTFTNLPTRTLTPAVTNDSVINDLYLMHNFNGGTGTLNVYKLSGSPGSETYTLVGATSPAQRTWSGGAGATLPQLGTTTKIEAADDSVQNVVYRNGSLWASQAVVDPNNRWVAQWWQTTTTGAVQQFGSIVGNTGEFISYPSIAANKNNDVLVGYSIFSASYYPSCARAFRGGGDPPNSMRAIETTVSGKASYVVIYGGNGRNRWGDYSATFVDPLNDIAMWTVQEYAETPANTWGTWWRFADVTGNTPYVAVQALDGTVYGYTYAGGTYNHDMPPIV